VPLVFDGERMMRALLRMVLAVTGMFLALPLVGCETSSAPPASSGGQASAPAVPPPPPGTGATAAATDASASSSDAESAFLAAYREAHDRHDAAALARLYCWDGVSPEWREVVMGNVEDEVLFPVTSAELVKAAPDEHQPETSDGKRYLPNLPPTHTLKVQFGKANLPPGELGLTAATFAVGMQRGQYRLVVFPPQ
jgi:hypothetical protein